MQVKTVKKIITSKMEEWIATLPENLQNKVRKNILVSGGSIVSLLNNEEVNDFDVYLQDMDTLKELVNHYARAHSLQVLDGRLPAPEDNGNKDFISVAYRTLKQDQIKILVSG